MAVDKTEPPIKVILGFAGLSIGTLLALRVFFVSYFNDQYESRSRAQIDTMLHQGSYIATALKAREEESRRLGGLDNAIRAVSQGQRPGSISPQASTDLAALQGWTLLPREVPRAAPGAAPAMETPPAANGAPAPTPGAGPAPTPGAGAAGSAPTPGAAAPVHPVLPSNAPAAPAGAPAQPGAALAAPPPASPTAAHATH